MHRIALVLGLLVWLTPAANLRAEEVRPDPAQLEFFEARVRPILVAHCLACHGAEKQKGGLRLDSGEALRKGGETGPVVAAGDPSASLLIEAIGYDGETQMPPKGKLKPREIEALTEWVKMGAPWPPSTGPTQVKTADARPKVDPRNHWAFQPIATPAVPPVKESAWPRGTIDHFVLARLEAAGLRPVEPADRRTLIRRVTFDLIGLPPSPEEIDAFLGDESPEAFGRVVDRLLASPRYGERWGRHWLDVARYGEDQAHTFEARLYPQGYRYRDWVVRALNADMPYDQFVTEQIAADLIDAPGRDDRLAALGFFALGPVYYGNAIADERDDRIDTLSRGFLGLTVSCARCHDHKFDPIPTKDYYALAGVFASTKYREYPAAPPEVVAAYEKAQAEVKTKSAEVEAFATLASQRLFFALPVSKAKTPDDRGIPAGLRPRLKTLRAALASLKAAAPPAPPMIHGLADSETIANLKVHLRGNPENLGDEAPRAFLTVLSPAAPAPFRQGSGRLELARAIVSKDNPLTPRVMVNRIWEHHFGRGLVATPSNFGTLGEPPSHPELLDYLASRFLALGWSLKAIHREIVMSQVYQLSSRIDPKAHEADPDNVLLWRMNRRRLEVEVWRDAMLAVSGNLDLTLGGPSQELTSPKNHRRTFYAAISRHNLDSLLRLFDFPDPNITCDRRAETAVPLQQLFVLNSEFMIEQARSLARRLTADPAEAIDAKVRRAYEQLYGRPATDDEVRWGVEFVTEGPTSFSSAAAGVAALSAWEQYAQVLLGANEFAFVD